VDLLSPVNPDLTGAGTADAMWLAWPLLSELPRWSPVPGSSGRVVVVAPHPDDEILGAGGTVARLVAAGAQHVAIAVTDGEASHPGRTVQLRKTRPGESEAAACVLGTNPTVIHRLGLPDGGVQALPVARALEDLIQPGDLVLAPWRGDGHPDHTQVGLGARIACDARGGELLSYLVWAWHWAEPDELPWAQARRVDLSPDLAQAKRRAVQCFQTQLEGNEPILAPATVTRLTRDFEIFLEP
jgi:LmbE family N-acetylglucosaminyl deacetylase